MRSTLLLGALFFLSCTVFGQITIDQNYTIEEYVNDILLGSGISASNIEFTGSEVQIGFLEGGEGTIFPMAAGLVLSSADASNLDQSGDGFGDVVFGEGVSGEPDLLEIANDVPDLIGESFSVSSVNDVCILEFDFIATGDTMSFNYSFGSDEYLEWVNSSFNDIFAFFLSGPGITGPYASPAGFPDGAVNIAEIPDSDPQIPITISSVNDALNSEYYIDNVSNDEINCDGFTTKLTAVAEVECGETYHIKLAIADGSDTALESIVVLESGSFSSNSVVEVDLSIDVGGPEANTIYEDCGEAVLTFTRPLETILEVEEMVIIDYSASTATNGVDFTELVDTVFFAPFVETVSFPLDAFEDGIAEGEEVVIMEILNVAACNGGGLTTYFEFFIADEPEPLVVDGYDIDLCLGDTLTLEPIITGGYGNYVYDWDTGEDTPTIDVNPDVSTSYNVIVGDTCGMPSDGADILVNILEFPPFDVVIDNGDLELGCSDFVTVTATATGGDGFYSYSWSNEDGDNLFGFGNSLFYSTWSGAEQIIVEVEDGCGFIVTDTIDVNLDVPDLVVSLEPTLEVACNEQFTLAPDIEGGADPFFYNWYVDGFWTDWMETFTYSTDEDITITMDIQDNCGQAESFDVEVTVVTVPVEIVMDDEVTGPCTETFAISPTVSGGNGDYDYVWTNEDGNTLSVSTSLNYSTDATETLFLTVSDGCGESADDQIVVNIVNPDLEVELGEDIDASCIDDTEVIAEVLSGSGGYTYTWSVEGTEITSGGSNTFSWQTFSTNLVTVDVTDACGGVTSDELTINIPNIPLSIQATPDTAICAGQNVLLLAEAFGGEGGFTYEWPQFSTAGPMVEFTPSNIGPATYEVIATDICGYEVETEIEVDVQDIEALFAVTYVSDTEVQFTSTPVPECDETCNFFWTFGDGGESNEPNPLHTYDGLEEYQASLLIVNEIGCRDSVWTIIDAPISLYVPNAFTPNNDGINDIFSVLGAGISEYEIIIFNRWGDVVFSSNDMNEPWIGDNKHTGEYYVPDGIYPWLIKLKGNDSEAFEKRGQVTVTR